MMPFINTKILLIPQNPCLEWHSGLLYGSWRSMVTTTSKHLILLCRGKYYFGKNGAAVTGVNKIGGCYYFFDDEGVMLTGWQESDGETYYYCTSGKRAVSRTVSIDGEKVKFNKDGKVVKKPAKKDTADTSDKEEIYPTELTVIKKEIPLAYHTTANITFSFKPINTTFREVTYKSSNPDIVSIDDNGKMTAHKSGSCYITITSTHDKSVSVTVKVTVS